MHSSTFRLKLLEESVERAWPFSGITCIRRRLVDRVGDSLVTNADVCDCSENG